jgi:hypothetical protein
MLIADKSEIVLCEYVTIIQPFSITFFRVMRNSLMHSNFPPIFIVSGVGSCWIPLVASTASDATMFHVQ